MTDTTRVSLGLEDAVAVALARNWDLSSSRQDLVVADANARTARAFPNPAVSAIVGKIHYDGEGDGTNLGNDFWDRQYDTVAQLGQLFEIGKRGPRKDAADAAALEAKARLEDVRRVVVEDVVQSYVGAAQAEADARIARQSAGYLHDEAQIAEVRWKAGDISHSDLDQIEIAASRLDLDARTAESAAITQRITLRTLLGLSEPGRSIAITDSLETLADRELAPPQTAPQGVRPDLASARAEEMRAAYAVKLEKAQRIPDPTLIFQYEHEPPVRSNTLGLGVSLPLPLWDHHGGAIAAAEGEREGARIEATRAQARVTADIETARATLAEATARWHRYRDDLRPKSEDIRRAVSLAYEKGGASLLDLLEAQRNDNDVRLATLQAASDAVIAAAALRSATTTMAVEDVHR